MAYFMEFFETNQPLWPMDASKSSFSSTSKSFPVFPLFCCKWCQQWGLVRKSLADNDPKKTKSGPGQKIIYCAIEEKNQNLFSKSSTFTLKTCNWSLGKLTDPLWGQKLVLDLSNLTNLSCLYNWFHPAVPKIRFSCKHMRFENRCKYIMHNTSSINAR